MLGYVEGIQRPEREEEVDTLTHQKWSGADLIDRTLQTMYGHGFSTAIQVTTSYFSFGPCHSVLVAMGEKQKKNRKKVFFMLLSWPMVSWKAVAPGDACVRALHG